MKATRNSNDHDDDDDVDDNSGHDDLDYKAGDEFELLTLPETSSKLRVVHLDTNLEGTVAETRLEIVENSIWAHAWYHGCISRVSAFSMLRPRELGTFLVRKSQGQETFVLAVKGEKDVLNWRVKG